VRVAGHSCLAGFCGQGLSPVAVRFCIQCEAYACLFLHTGFAVVVQTERGPVASQHARGLTIQLSQGQGRQLLRPEGAPPAAGVPRSHAARAFDGGEEAAG